MRRRNLPPMAPRVFVAPARDLGLTPAPRVDAPVAFAAFRAATLRRPDTASSPRGVLRRACDEPRRRVSLSSALGPPRRFLSFQAVRFFRSFCAAPPPAAPLGVRGRSGGGRKSPRRPDASPMRVSASGASWSAASIRNVERPLGRSRRVLRGELAPVAGLARKQSAKESFGARLEGARTAPGAAKKRASASTGARENEKS